MDSDFIQYGFKKKIEILKKDFTMFTDNILTLLYREQNKSDNGPTNSSQN